MPQFYWFTFVASAAIGWMLREYLITYDVELFKWMALLFILIFINEKTASMEDIIDHINRVFKK
jgi:hypothetical protein